MLGKVVRERRIALGLKQQVLADRMGMPRSQSVVSEIENGTRTNLTTDVLQRLANALEVPIEQLMRAARDETAVLTSEKELVNPPLDLLRPFWEDWELEEIKQDWGDLSPEERASWWAEARAMQSREKKILAAREELARLKHYRQRTEITG